MITIRRMTPEDLPLGLELSAQAGWNQTAADWRRFLFLEPEGCFVAAWVDASGEATAIAAGSRRTTAARSVATTAAFAFGPVGWIAMVLVDEPFRHRGIASQLVEHAIRFLEDRGVRTIRLDATPLGRPVYERLGFVPEYSLVRLQGVVHTAIGGFRITVRTADQVGAIGALDQHLTGTPRQRLIQALVDQHREALVTAVTDEGLAGYALYRPGRRATQIGPAMALSTRAGAETLGQLLQRCPSGPVFVDVPTDNADAIAWFTARDFTLQREFTRMCRGRRIEDFPGRIWASSGPEKG